MQSDHLEAIFNKLEDETNKKHLPYDFIVSYIEDVRQLEMYLKKQTEFADDSSIYISYDILNESKCSERLEVDTSRLAKFNMKRERERKLWKYALIELCIHTIFGNYFL